VAVDERVVGEQSFRLDPVGGEVRKATLDEGGHRRGAVVAVELAVGVAGVVVDEGVHPFVADPHPLLLAAYVAVASDGVAGAAEADEALAVDVQQIARTGPLVEAWPLAWLPGRR
jgi:hypothetical protein